MRKNFQLKNNKVIPNLIWNLPHKPFIGKQQTAWMRDPGVRAAPASSGMTPNFITANTRGFTLIELLVVVLIIGILAAVALPQYQKAVWKSRAGQIMSVVRSLAEAEKVYFLANGTYTDDITQLDLNFTQPTTYDEHKSYWTLHAEAIAKKVVYAEINRWGDPHFYISYDLGTDSLECFPEPTSPNGQDICKLLSKTSPFACTFDSRVQCYKI